jgi:hypothetical protein
MEILVDLAHAQQISQLLNFVLNFALETMLPLAAI